MLSGSARGKRQCGRLRTKIGLDAERTRDLQSRATRKRHARGLRLQKVLRSIRGLGHEVSAASRPSSLSPYLPY